MDLNPVIVSPRGAVAVDVKVRLMPVARDPLAHARACAAPNLSVIIVTETCAVLRRPGSHRRAGR